MPGTKSGGLKAKATNLAKNPNFYREIGKIGGQISKTGGFAYMAQHDPERLKNLSVKGGSVSRRTKSNTTKES